MRLRCERDDLLRAVQETASVVASKSVHPVYESVEIVAGKDGLTLLATDLEIGMKLRLPAGERLTVEEQGTAVVPAQRLAAIVRELPKGEVRFQWNAESRESLIEAGRGRFKLQGQSPEDFPEVPEVDGAQAVTVAGGALREMVRRTHFAAAKERMRFALNGVLVKVEGETLELVATDGRRLARDVGVCQNPSGAKIQAIVPSKGLQQLDRMVESPEQAVRLAVGSNHFCARTDRTTLVSRLVEGSFPNYRDVIPQTCKQKAVLPREALVAALRRASLVTSRDAQSVRLQFHAEGLTVSARSAEGSAEETIACDYAGAGEVLGYNPEFLLDALAVMTAESVPFEWDGKSAPGKLTEGSYTYVVMPVSLDCAAAARTTGAGAGARRRVWGSSSPVCSPKRASRGAARGSRASRSSGSEWPDQSSRPRRVRRPCAAASSPSRSAVRRSSPSCRASGPRSSCRASSSRTRRAA